MQNFPQPIAITPGSHALFGASSAFRWVRCGASVRLQSGIPNVSGPAAKEGTRVHEWLAYFLSEHTIPSADLIGMVHPDNPANTLTEGDVEILSQVVRYILNHVAPEYELFVEKTWALPEISARAFGTADVVIRRPDGSVVVVDYKNGAVPVSAANNYQLMFYGLASRGPGARVEGWILQNDYGKLRHSEAVYAEDALQTFAFEAAIAAAGADTSDPVPGSHCKYCRAVAVRCEAVADIASEVTASPVPVGLTPETAPAALAKCGALSAYIAAVEEQAMAMAMRGKPPIGYKLIEGRGSRDWVDPEAPQRLEAATGVTLHVTEWLSVAQSEKALGKQKAAAKELIAYKPGKPKLVTSEYEGKEYTPAQPNNFVSIDV